MANCIEILSGTKKKLCIIVSNVNKALAFEWVVNNLDNNQFDLYILLLNRGNSELEKFLSINHIWFQRIVLIGKKDYPRCLLTISRALKQLKPDIIHTHLRDADLLGQLAAFILRVPRRIYTRHSSTFNHIYHKNSVIADRLVNYLATDIVAISEVTKNTLVNMENVPSRKISLIHHGFDIESFQRVDAARVNDLRKKYYLDDRKIIVGVISRYTEWKGYQYMIPAFAKLAADFNDMHFIFANANGDYSAQVKQLLNICLPVQTYTEIAFESDLQALYQLLNVYVHAPVDDTIEAFGQTYVEALAAGIPSVFTRSGVANEFIVHEQNALVVPHKNSDEIYKAVSRLLTDENLRDKLVTNGRRSVRRFDLDASIDKLTALYLS